MEKAPTLLKLVLKLAGACGSFSACYYESLLILIGYLVFVHSFSLFNLNIKVSTTVHLLVWIVNKAFSYPGISFQAS